MDYKNEVLEIKVNDGAYRITSYSKSIIETTFIPSGESFDGNSHAVLLKPESVTSDLLENNNSIELKTKGISVSIQK